MEHILHLFGGGCGEHVLWPMLLASMSGALIWVKGKLNSKKKEEGNA